MLKNEWVTSVRKLGSKLLITRQKCVKVRPDQTNATAKLQKGSLSGIAKMACKLLNVHFLWYCPLASSNFIASNGYFCGGNILQHLFVIGTGHHLSGHFGAGVVGGRPHWAGRTSAQECVHLHSRKYMKMHPFMRWCNSWWYSVYSPLESTLSTINYYAKWYFEDPSS